MSGTRLDKFMKNVEAAAGGVTAGDPATESGEAAASNVTRGQEAATDTSQRRQSPMASKRAGVGSPPASGPGNERAVNDAWTGLLDAGLKLIETLSATHKSDSGKSSDFAARIETDPDNGQTYVKVPIPDTETVQRLVCTLSDLLQRNPRG